MATPSDASSYTPYILNTSITFESEITSKDNFKLRIESYLKTRPWLVFEMDGKIAGYAYESHYRERTCYQWSTECSAYVRENFQGKNIGRTFMKYYLKYYNFKDTGMYMQLSTFLMKKV